MLVLAAGLFAVGPGRIYHGDTWPDFLAMFVACALILGGGVDLAGRDASGAWSWRTLRPRSFAALGSAFVLLVAATALDPVGTGISPVGDSAQGFSMFDFLGCLGLAATAAIRAPLSPQPPVARPPRLWGGAWAAPVRFELRRYRLLSRMAYLEVGPSTVTIVVPRVFGGQQSWEVPIHMLGVVLPPTSTGRGHTTDLVDRDQEVWVTRQAFQVPYLSTTSPLARPNLTLLFTVPQRLPPVRWSAGSDLGISSAATRSERGVEVDGVQLRVLEPVSACQAVMAAGAQVIADVDEFVKRNRDVVRDPETARKAVATRHRSRVIAAGPWVALMACFIASMVTDDDRYGIALVAFGVVGGLVGLIRGRAGS